MRLSLEITVIAIVLLVIAAVLIGIFVTGVNNVNPYTDARANCINTGFSVCKSMGVLPPMWSTQTYIYNGQQQTCQQITGYNDCSPLGVPKCSGTCKISCDMPTEKEIPSTQGTCTIGQICCTKKV